MIFRYILLFLVASATVSTPISAAASQQLPQCAAPETARPLPAAAVCLRQAGVDLQGSTDAESARKLFEQAKTQVVAGRFDQAGRILDCADTVLGANADPLARYELVRQRGVLEYQRERIPQALSRFECALKLSSARQDQVATARDLNNVGSALRRLGDFRNALRSLVLSLQMKRANGQPIGAVLNNIADVYRELEDYDEAMQHYQQASQILAERADKTEYAHTLESMAELELERDQNRRAEELLRQALAVYREQGNRVYELLIHDGLIRAALGQGDLAQANSWIASTLAIVSENKMALPSTLRLQIARSERMSGRVKAARAQLNAALAEVPPGEATRSALLEELAILQENSGDIAALQTLRQVHAEAVLRARAQHDQQLTWMRTRFETAERDRTIDILETENRLRSAELRQRTLWLWLIAVAVLAAALLLWLWWQRRRHIERIRQEVRRVRHEQELSRYRHEADALAHDRNLLQLLLDSREDAVCLLDAEGTVLAANRTASTLLGISGGTPAAQMLSKLISDADALILSAALESIEDSAEQQIEVARRDGARLLARLSPWAGGDGLIVLTLNHLAESIAINVAEPDTIAVANVGSKIATEQSLQQSSIEPNQTGQMQARNEFRRMLVELMLAAVDAWERATASNRLELAEKSRIWRVNIDDGRLRARAMERYLGVTKLPQNPRWRDVLRTAYFVLGKCENLPETTRADLQIKIDAVLAHTRQDG